MTLNIGLIARTLNAQHLRGTGRYVQELLKNTSAEDAVRWTAFGHDPSRPFRVPADFAGRADVFSFRGDRFHLWEQLGLPLRLRSAGVHLLHGAENTLPIWQPVPSIVTIHDTVLFEEAVRGAPHHLYLQNVQTLALRRCAHVITISESSRRDIAERWPFLSDRLTVIPHGIGDDFFKANGVAMPSVLREALAGSPYLLYLGGAQPRKRFGWALDLLARSNRSELHLVACGFGAGTAPAADALPEALRGRVHFAPFVEDAELVALYRGATAAVYPTLYEGFGFPAVEAQAAGTPILFSPVSSLVDLVGPLAWAVAPDDFPAWQRALAEVLSLPAQARGELATRGMAWARQFSWRRSVEAHFAVYREVLSRQQRA